MNKENMQKLINAIMFDGKTKFNMSVFIGKLNYERDEAYVFKHDELASQYSASRVTSIVEGAKIFNCTSMGCIAGFATALANDWKAPVWLSEDNHINHVQGFEHTSNEFLGLNYAEGKNIYFGDGNSIWKWLMVKEPERYPELRLEEYGTIEAAEEENVDWWEDDVVIDFSTIDYITAVDVLTRIMNEEIGLCNEEGEPYYINKEVVSS